MRIYDDEPIRGMAASEMVSAQSLGNEEIRNQMLSEAENKAMTGDRERGEVNGIMLGAPSQVIGIEQIKEALGVLQKYKSGKAELEARIVDEENFYMLQYYKRAKQKVGKDGKIDGETPASAWLFNSLQNKHADGMDNYPEPHCLPRERSDEEEASRLNSILPVIIEQNDFEKTYSDAWWYKLKHGTAVYSVLWNPELDGGLGNIDIGCCDVLNLYWDMAVDDIQNSANLFYVALEDNDSLELQYPQLKGKLKGSSADYKRYNHNTADITDKTMVIDWYYKKNVNGQNVVHYCKFVENHVLYASENDAKYAISGFYEHGKYPFVMDVLFPESGTAAGFGIIAIGRDPQVYIDLIDKAILDYAMKAAKPRWLGAENCGINDEDWLNWDKPIVHVQGTGDVSEQKFSRIELAGMPSFVRELKSLKIDELKETTSNRDFSNGSTSSGVTSGAAIATLQEAGNKTSRDMIKGTYRAYKKVVEIVIELIRQFYTEQRSFRITDPNGGTSFIDYQNSGLQPQMQTVNVEGNEMPIRIGETALGEPEYAVRVPIMDIDIKAQKQNPFTTLAQNETAINLYNAGFFEPERAQQAMICLEMMDFEGKDKVYEYVQQGQTLMNQVQQLNQQVMQASDMLAMAGINPSQFGLMPIQMPMSGAPSGSVTTENPVSVATDNAVDAQNGYMQKLMEKARV